MRKIIKVSVCLIFFFFLENVLKFGKLWNRVVQKLNDLNISAQSLIFKIKTTLCYIFYLYKNK